MFSIFGSALKCPSLKFRFFSDFAKALPNAHDPTPSLPSSAHPAPRDDGKAEHIMPTTRSGSSKRKAPDAGAVSGAGHQSKRPRGDGAGLRDPYQAACAAVARAEAGAAPVLEQKQQAYAQADAAVAQAETGYEHGHRS